MSQKNKCGKINNFSEEEKIGMTKSLVLKGHGDYDKVKVVYRTKPLAQKGQVVVNIKAAGVNFFDLMIRMGAFCDEQIKPPYDLGQEGSGVVSEVGEGVQEFKAGDRVMCVQKNGLWSEHVAVDAQHCFAIPDEMTHEEAAAIPVNYITAYHTLFELGNLKQGKSVLVHMAAGGVGVAATQLIGTVPDTTIFGTCSAAKHKVVESFGVQYPIDYRTKDYVEEVKKVSPEGVDIVLDPLSGEDSGKGYQLLKPMGSIIHYGVTNFVKGTQRSIWQMFKTFMKGKSYCPMNMIADNKGAYGYNLDTILNNKKVIKSTTVELLSMYKLGQVKPQIDSVWAFEDVGQAMARLHERRNIGKVILSPQRMPGEKEIRNIVFEE